MPHSPPSAPTFGGILGARIPESWVFLARLGDYFREEPCIASGFWCPEEDSNYRGRMPRFGGILGDASNMKRVAGADPGLTVEIQLNVAA